MNDEPPQAIATAKPDDPEPLNYAKPRRSGEWRKAFRWTGVAVLVIVLATNGIALYGSSGGDIGIQKHRARQRLDILRGQMDGIAERLRGYRSTYGRYPTNDEGLTVLDPMPGRFKVWVPAPATDPPTGFPNSSAGLGWETLDMRLTDLRSHAARTGASFLKMAQEQIPSSFRGIEPDFWGAPGWPLQLEVGGRNELYIIGRGGVLEPWLVPFGYENRNGIPASDFAGSPVDEDTRRKYSVRVDRGVFVYSFGAMECSQDLRQLWWRSFWFNALCLGLVLPALGVAVQLVRKHLWPLALMLVLGALGLGAVTSVMSRALCYVARELFTPQRPRDLVARQEALLTRYRDAGIITQATFDRSMEPIEHVKAAPTKVP